ncbi:hypothetical protein H310_07627 [Aphanomyces invadans]|uniref:B box-type domain-containing protein n=1 Tax=Aphanomyces invadans TaxID=157072 RepID=A0A024U1C8_9STRA|nr:hypothetical protein H310_07627 [Aphanomyces invadans]ETW00236.1 hypothetical protein H310_07627 [Aphanomyces invadans]|eukprot:XP_008871261.1 hypothetical protein H310_07627 [Aphanomyces invadans]
MLGRWGDFDSDVLLNANLSQEDHAYLDAGGGSSESMQQLARRHTADNSKQNLSSTMDRPVRTAATSTALAPPPLSRQTYRHVNAKCAMFSWMLESDSLRHTVFDALAPVWVAAKIAAGHTTIISPHVLDLVAQRLAKRFPGTALPSHGVLKDRQMHADSFCTILAHMITPVVTNTTIPECLFAVRSIVEAIVCHDVRGDASVQFRPIEAIEPIQAVSRTLPPLSRSSNVSAIYMEPAVNQSLTLDIPAALQLPSSLGSSRLVPGSSGAAPDMAAEARLVQEDQLKQKLRLRKYWSSQACETAAHILPEEIPLFQREDMRSRAKSREQSRYHDEATPMQVDTRPPTRTSCDSTSDIATSRPPTRLHSARLQDPFPVPNNDITQQEGTNESSMALVCTQCDINEATLWCSQCYTITCVRCWSASHSTPVPTIHVSLQQTDPLRSCVLTQSLTSLHQGPPLPLLRTPPTHTTHANALRRRQKGSRLHLTQPQEDSHTREATFHVANSLPLRVMSMPSLPGPLPDAARTTATEIISTKDPANTPADINPTMTKPSNLVTKRRQVLRHASVDINAMFLEKVTNSDLTIP